MKESFSLAMIDLNQFKLINDQYGHKIGDEVLIKFAKFVQRNIYDDDFFGRYGGDEFILLFPKRDLKDSEMILYNLKTKMMQDTYLSNFQISFTYGCVEVSHDTEEVVELLDKADQRMYDYKKR
jgi:diguanylate cyclase (GGDEF)-like protein